jgi:peptidoglycan L-alanyl-D-glutamate endopeptidase CwlK
MTFKFGPRSLNNLIGVHPDLVKVAMRAIDISEVDFAITEGLRTAERQAQLVKSGASRTQNSRHLTGHAIDVAAYVMIDGKNEVRWDWPLYTKIARAMNLAAEELGIHIEWGGSWLSFPDGPHFQLPRKEYP